MAREMYFIEVNGVAQPCSLAEWALLPIDITQRIVRQSQFEDGTLISTTFLGINHNWGDGPPILYETMIFRQGTPAADQERYSTRAQALEGHERARSEVIGNNTMGTPDIPIKLMVEAAQKTPKDECGPMRHAPYFYHEHGEWAYCIDFGGPELQPTIRYAGTAMEYDTWPDRLKRRWAQALVLAATDD